MHQGKVSDRGPTVSFGGAFQGSKGFLYVDEITDDITGRQVDQLKKVFHTPGLYLGRV